MKTLTIIVISLLLFLFLTKTSLATIRCETSYGASETCVKTGQLQIDKQVWHPVEKKFVDNLGLTDYKFSLGEEITFRLKIKNVGDATFDKVNVQDTLPGYLGLSSGELSFEIKDLTVDKTEEREIKTKVVPGQQIPDNKSIICVVNTAEIWSGNERDKDTSQICLEKKVLGAKILPKTGPENWLIILGGSLASGIVGIYLIKMAKEGR